VTILQDDILELREEVDFYKNRRRQ
jgi:hypothetical protein